MPPRRSNEETKGFLREWLAEWPKIAASLTVAFLLFAIPLAFRPVRNLIFPPAASGYPVVCTAEPVWQRGADRRLVEIYLINASTTKFRAPEDLRQKLSDALGDNAKGASTAVLFPYQPDEPRAESATPDGKFNEGKGELSAQLTDRGVVVQPLSMSELAILRVNVIFPKENGTVPFQRGAKGAAGMFDVKGPEEACYTRP